MARVLAGQGRRSTVTTAAPVCGARSVIVKGLAILAFLTAVTFATPGRAQFYDLNGTWAAAGTSWTYRITQSGNTFSWVTLSGGNETANGTINGPNIQVTWTGAGGTGSGTGVVSVVDGRMQFRLSNGALLVKTSGAPAQAPQQQGLRRVVLQGVIGGRTITADVRRVAGSQWTWVENNVTFNFRALTESPAEIVIHDPSRDMYHHFNLQNRQTFWRIGTASAWNPHYTIVSVE